jgi:hypothetical protein
VPHVSASQHDVVGEKGSGEQFYNL